MNHLSPDRVLLLVTFMGLGALLHLLAGPMTRRSVNPDRGYGLRVPATLADESVWYDANEATGRDLRRGVKAFAMLAVIGFLSPVADEVFGLAMASASVVGLILATVVGWRRANRLLRARRAG